MAEIDVSTFSEKRYATPEEAAFLTAQWPQEKRHRWILQNCYFGHGQMLMRSQRYLIVEGVEQVKTTYLCECGYKLVQYIPRMLALTVVDEECLPPPLQA